MFTELREYSVSLRRDRGIVDTVTVRAVSAAVACDEATAAHPDAVVLHVVAEPQGPS